VCDFARAPTIPALRYSPTPHATACKPQPTTKQERTIVPMPTPLFLLFDVAQPTILKKYSIIISSSSPPLHPAKELYHYFF
jgi:hypothetical protein